MAFRRPKPKPVVYGPCGECPKGHCDRCEFCRDFARPIR